MGPFIYLLSVMLILFNYCHSHSEHSLVLMVSFDGFRWDYLQQVHEHGKATPNFDTLIREGVSVKGPGGMTNSFTTITFPNHYTLATGMYEENHGVVGNEMYDPVLNETFRREPEQEKDPRWWNNGTDHGGPEPIWLTNQKGSEYTPFKKRSGVYFWPGSEASINEHHPHHFMPYVPYDKSTKFEPRIDTMVEWFSTEDEPINLGLLYFEEPDLTGHDHGPDSQEVVDKVVELDNVLGYLLERLKEHHLHTKMNLIVTSDHGMSRIDDIIYLDEFVDPDLYTHFGETIIWQILPKDGKEQEVLEAFRNVPNIKVYVKDNIPDRFHFKNNRRIQPIVLVAEKGYMLCHHVNESHCWKDNKGDHGYDNEDIEMHPIFIAHGPAFKKGYQSQGFNSVDIYPLLCHILDIEPGPHDGNLENIEEIMFVHDNSVTTMITFMLTVVFAALLSGLCCVGVCRVHRYHRYKRYIHAVVPMNDMEHPVTESQTHLLVSDEEEEIP